MAKVGPQESFFAQLPQRSLLPLEVQIRDCLKQTASLANKLLPHDGTITIQDWVERRLPDELVLRVNAKGRIVLLSLTGYGSEEMEVDTSVGRQGGECQSIFAAQRRQLQPAPPPSPPPCALNPRTVAKASETRINQESFRAKGKGTGKMNDSEVKGKGKNKGTRTSEAFLKSLPADTFTDDEYQLRDAILRFLSPYHEPVTFLACSGNETVECARQKFLPAECPLKDWIIGRIGSDVPLVQDETGQWLLYPKESAIDTYRQQQQRDERDEETEAFFAELPPDTFTPEEDRLRDALDNFLQNWSKPDPPTLSDVGCDPAVRDARNALVPRSHPERRSESLNSGTKTNLGPTRVTLRRWMDRRVADEFETFDIDNVVVFGYKGTVDKDAAVRLVEGQQKRKAAGLDSTTAHAHLKRKPRPQALRRRSVS